MAGKSVLLYHLSPEYEGIALVGLTMFAMDEEGQMEILGTLEIAPFDTNHEIGVWVSRMLAQREKRRLR